MASSSAVDPEAKQPPAEREAGAGRPVVEGVVVEPEPESMAPGAEQEPGEAEEPGVPWAPWRK
jgi:hypothetical protein